VFKGMLPFADEQNLIRNNNRPGPGSGNGVEFFSGGSLGWLVTDNYFTGNDSADVLIVGGTTVANVTIDSNEFTNSTGNPIAAFAADNLQVLNNTITGAAFSAVYFGGGVVNSVISGNAFTSNAGRAVRIQDAGYGTGPNANITITGNTVTNNDRGIVVESGGYTGTLNVINNSITGSTNEALDLHGFATLNLTNHTQTGNGSGGSITSVGTVNLDTNNSGNTVRVNVTAANLISEGVLSVDGQFQEITYSGVTTLDVDTLDGNATVNVAAHSTTLIDLDGGAPMVGDPGVPPGDTLNYFTDGTPFAFGPTTITTTGKANINHANFETFNTLGTPTISGSGDDDLLIIIASNSNSGTYQLIQDFRGENGGPFVGPAVAFSGIASFTFNGLGGDDRMSDQQPGGRPVRAVGRRLLQRRLRQREQRRRRPPDPGRRRHDR